MIDHLELIGAVATAHRGGVLDRKQALYLIDLVLVDGHDVDDQGDDVVDVEPAAVPTPIKPPAKAAAVDPIGCPSCERTFASSHALSIHRSRAHPTGAKVAPPAVGEPAKFPQLGPIASTVDDASARERAAAAL